MTVEDEEFLDKVFRVISSCTTPEHFRLAQKYLKLAENAGYVHGLTFPRQDIPNEVHRTRH